MSPAEQPTRPWLGSVLSSLGDREAGDFETWDFSSQASRSLLYRAGDLPSFTLLARMMQANQHRPKWLQPHNSLLSPAKFTEFVFFVIVSWLPTLLQFLGWGCGPCPWARSFVAQLPSQYPEVLVSWNKWKSLLCSRFPKVPSEKPVYGKLEGTMWKKIYVIQICLRNLGIKIY
jgi:hypothetical protein